MRRILRHMSQNICLSLVVKRQLVVSFKIASTWKLSKTAAFLSRINYNEHTEKVSHTSAVFRSSRSYVSYSVTWSRYIKPRRTGCYPVVFGEYISAFSRIFIHSCSEKKALHSFFFNRCTVHLDTIKVLHLPTDALYISLMNH